MEKFYNPLLDSNVGVLEKLIIGVLGLIILAGVLFCIGMMALYNPITN